MSESKVVDLKEIKSFEDIKCGSYIRIETQGIMHPGQHVAFVTKDNENDSVRGEVTDITIMADKETRRVRLKVLEPPTRSTRYKDSADYRDERVVKLDEAIVFALRKFDLGKVKLYFPHRRA